MTHDDPARPHDRAVTQPGRVGKAAGGAVKAAGIKYRSTVHGPMDMKVDPKYGNVYWNEPDGHMWEMLTVSHARPAR